jgi:site-specific DNA recombinase
MTRPAAKTCAIYTRKSSDEGLEQSFNSLDAQREACAAYIRSQVGEGWTAAPACYDDGGYSGGSMERPALQRLLADIAAGRIDVVVVYKIDRLTRSLADFARIVESFDARGVSFVSVTQAFNTTSSMGRLTLNVLLSFAQFEREVTGERIRDKIAASKARGMWMGGIPPLGYDAPTGGTRALQVNAAEAEAVRHIFRSYLDLGSVHALERRLAEQGIVSKRHVTAKGRVLGGAPFSRGALFHLLRNRTYLGMTLHGGTAHPGLHPAIMESDLFDAVTRQLDAHARRRGRRASAGGTGDAATSPDTAPGSAPRAPLTGRIVDATGAAMSPATARGARGRLYRYYVSAQLQQGRRRAADLDDGVLRRVAAAPLEARLAEILRRLVDQLEPDPLEVLRRVEIRRDLVRLTLPAEHLTTIRARLAGDEVVTRDANDPRLLHLTVPLRLAVRGGRTTIEGTGRRETVRPDRALIAALREAQGLLRRDTRGLPVLDAVPHSSYKRRLLRLAFLAPDLQRTILEGRQPPGLTLADLMALELPLGWADQHKAIAAAVG